MKLNIGQKVLTWLFKISFMEVNLPKKSRKNKMEKKCNNKVALY